MPEQGEKNLYLRSRTAFATILLLLQTPSETILTR